MKTFNSTLFLAFVIRFTTNVAFGQSPALKTYVEEYNKLCPLQQGIFTATGATIKEGSVAFENLVDENAIDFATISNNGQQFKQNKFKMLAFVEDVDELFTELEKSRSGLTYRYTGSSSGASLVISFSADEVRQIINYSQDPIPFLKTETASTNLLMPIKIDNIQTATKMALENNYVVYYINIDENLYSLEKLNNISDTRKSTLLKAWHNPDDPGYIIARACKKARYGIEYRYTGNKTDNIVSITIEWTEL